VKVVQAATAPVKPVFPPKPLVIALGMVIQELADYRARR
jgi:uncharacterized protein involved in exopolysaccharide biosynthesis